MKKLLSLLFTMLLSFCFAVPARAQDLTISARAYVLYCVNSGETLLSGDPDTRLPMASTTKIMTALITLEEAEKDNRVVTFTDEMSAEGSSMYLRIGEQVRLSDLAAGMMMQSGNDAANAAAIAIDGSIDQFCRRMNRRAAEFGMKNTRFMTPSGLDDSGHYSTARDMALLMAHALKNNSFCRLAAQRSVTVRFIKPADKRVTYPNHNRLLNLYDSCIGGKTGYTEAAERCLVSAARRDGLTLVAVTLDDRDDWNDHIALFDEGFSRYTMLRPDIAPDQRIPVVGGDADEAAFCAKGGDGIAVERDRINKVQATVITPPFLYAPIQKNDVVGRVIYTSDGKKLGEIPLLSADTIAYDSRRRGFFEYIGDVLRL